MFHHIKRLDMVLLFSSHRHYVDKGKEPAGLTGFVNVNVNAAVTVPLSSRVLQCYNNINF